MRIVKRKELSDTEEYALSCVPSGVTLICPYVDFKLCGSACAAFECNDEHEPRRYFCSAMNACIGLEAPVGIPEWLGTPAAAKPYGSKVQLPPADEQGDWAEDRRCGTCEIGMSSTSCPAKPFESCCSDNNYRYWRKCDPKPADEQGKSVYAGRVCPDCDARHVTANKGSCVGCIGVKEPIPHPHFHPKQSDELPEDPKPADEQGDEVEDRRCGTCKFECEACPDGDPPCLQMNNLYKWKKAEPKPADEQEEAVEDRRCMTCRFEAKDRCPKGQPDCIPSNNYYKWQKADPKPDLPEGAIRVRELKTDDLFVRNRDSINKISLIARCTGRYTHYLTNGQQLGNLGLDTLVYPVAVTFTLKGQDGKEPEKTDSPDLRLCSKCNRREMKHNAWCARYCNDKRYWQPADTKVMNLDDGTVRVPKGMADVIHDINNLLQQSELGVSVCLSEVAEVMQEYNDKVQAENKGVK